MDVIPVTPLPSRGSRDWAALRRSFRNKPALALGQAWRPHHEALFAAGQVRLGLAGMSLAVHAVLRDRDVFNPVAHFNVPAFSHGDTFEVFLQPVGQPVYYEFHVASSGALTQLRWPSPARELSVDWTGLSDPLLAYKVSRWRVRSTVQSTREGWEIHVEIPLKRIFEDAAPWTGSGLRANFARYDHTRGRPRPVLSATAPLLEPDFHRAREWHALELRFR